MARMSPSWRPARNGTGNLHEPGDEPVLDHVGPGGVRRAGSRCAAGGPASPQMRSPQCPKNTTRCVEQLGAATPRSTSPPSPVPAARKSTSAVGAAGRLEPVEAHPERLGHQGSPLSSCPSRLRSQPIGVRAAGLVGEDRGGRRVVAARERSTTRPNGWRRPRHCALAITACTDCVQEGAVRRVASRGRGRRTASRPPRGARRPTPGCRSR